VISIWLVGRILDTTHNYVVVFTFLGLLMPLAYLFGTFLMGKAGLWRCRMATWKS
jgi:hypothetical protein